ncbi:hypothetical protein VTK26DRAFT_6388 [Humicola hyalothermophila]
MTGQSGRNRTWSSLCTSQLKSHYIIVCIDLSFQSDLINSQLTPPHPKTPLTLASHNPSTSHTPHTHRYCISQTRCCLDHESKCTRSKGNQAAAANSCGGGRSASASRGLGRLGARPSRSLAVGASGGGGRSRSSSSSRQGSRGGGRTRSSWGPRPGVVVLVVGLVVGIQVIHLELLRLGEDAGVVLLDALEIELVALAGGHVERHNADAAGRESDLAEVPLERGVPGGHVDEHEVGALRVRADGFPLDRHALGEVDLVVARRRRDPDRVAEGRGQERGREGEEGAHFGGFERNGCRVNSRREMSEAVYKKYNK